MAVVDGIHIPSTGLPPERFFNFEDGYGNFVLPVFTDPERARSFVAEFAPDFRTDRFGPIDALDIIAGESKRDAAFFALDPRSVTEFQPLELFELLFEIMKLAYGDGVAGVEWGPGQFDRKPGD